MRSLTTLSTPHNGLTLIQKLRDRPNSYSQHTRFLERAYSVVGLGAKNIHEFSMRNMEDFNLVCEDRADVNYYSFGSKKKEL